MGSIVAYYGANTGDNSDRQEGMRLLGKELIDKVTGEPTVDKVHDAITTAFAMAQISLHFQNSDTAAGQRGLKIAVVNPPASKKFTCDLVDASNAPAGTLTVQFDRDPDKTNGNPANSKFTLNVMYPETADNSATYLQDTATDVEEILDSGATTPLTEAARYLAAFKFLSRCK